MSEKSDESEGDYISVSARVTTKFKDEFDRTVKKSQIEGQIPMDASRAEVIRGLMKLAVDDPDLMAKAWEVES